MRVRPRAEAAAATIASGATNTAGFDKGLRTRYALPAKGGRSAVNKRKLLAKAMNSPHNLGFPDFLALIEAFGFVLLRQRGSHHIFARPGLVEIMDVQPQGGKAKAYQVKQLIELVTRHGLTLEDQP
jgi:hypothetical protein